MLARAIQIGSFQIWLEAMNRGRWLLNQDLSTLLLHEKRRIFVHVMFNSWY